MQVFIDGMVKKGVSLNGTYAWYTYTCEAPYFNVPSYSVHSDKYGVALPCGTRVRLRARNVTFVGFVGLGFVGLGTGVW